MGENKCINIFKLTFIKKIIAKQILKEAVIDFIFQDTSLMDRLFLGIPIYSRTEITVRLIFLLLLIAFFWGLLRPKTLLELIIIVISSHFINWFFNGHGYQIFYEIIGLRYSADRAVNYILRLKEEAEEKSLHLMVYGSWSRGEATEKSDIDIFVINTESSLLKSLRLGFISMKYRLLALFTPLSVDIYVIDRLDYLKWRKKTKPKENPIILNDPTGVIRDIYEGRETKLEDFMDALKRLYKG